MFIWNSIKIKLSTTLNYYKIQKNYELENLLWNLCYLNDNQIN